MTKNNRRHLAITAGSLIAILICFELTPADLWLQQFLYDATNQQWIWSRTEPLTRFVFYDGIKMLLIAFGAALACCLFFIPHSKYVGEYSSGIRIVLLSLILVPACVGALKNTTNVALWGATLHITRWSVKSDASRQAMPAADSLCCLYVSCSSRIEIADVPCIWLSPPAGLWAPTRW